MANGRENRKKAIAAHGPWVPVPLDFLRSRACAELSPHGAKLLLDLLSLLKPNAVGNGDLSLSPKTMGVRGWSGRATLRAAVSELMEHGLLIQTHQGSRLDCCLFALTIFPMDCDLRKVEVGPGSYTHFNYEKGGARPPTPEAKAKWRRARKTISVAPPRNEVNGKRTATVQTPEFPVIKSPPLYRHGTNSQVFAVVTVPPRVTSLKEPSVGVGLLPRIPASRTRMGQMLRCTRPTNRPATYHAARANFAHLTAN